MKESEKMPYDQSRLKDWLATDSWSAQEAVCLLSDVDPTGAVISWGGFTNTYGGHVDSPKIEHGQLLSEGKDLAFSESADRVLDVTSSYPDEPFFDANKLIAGTTAETQRMSLRIDAERHMRRAWDLYRRNPEHSEDDQRPPCEFVEWGKTQGLDIPWLDWAKVHGLVTTERSKLSGGKTKKETDSQKIDQISELREAAVQIAIKRRVNDGMLKKHITVKKISVWLLESGKFSTGEPFSTRWREVEGIRSLLKAKHNPLSDKRYLAAKPIKSPKFNP